MISLPLHAASDDEITRLERAIVAGRVFSSAAELWAVHDRDPWSIRVSETGDLLVLGAWREHLPYLFIEALWCRVPAIPDVLAQARAIAGERGLVDVVSPPVRLEETAAYLQAGMQVSQKVLTMVRQITSAGAPEPVLPEGMTLWTAGSDDLATLLGVDAACFDDFWRYDTPHMLRFLAESRLVLAEVDGVPVGYTLCTMDRGQGNLGRLCVLPDYRRRGIGRALLADAVHWVHEKGGDRVTLSTQKDNAGSQALYRSQGFRDTGQSYVFMRFGAEG